MLGTPNTARHKRWLLAILKWEIKVKVVVGRVVSLIDRREKKIKVVKVMESLKG